MATNGIRLNNPGNIERGDPWQGLHEIQSNERFCRFVAAKWGIRAIVRTLITYQDKHGIYTIGGAISRWAPPSDNNPTVNYIDFVSDTVGIHHSQAVDFTDYRVMRGLVVGIIKFENGVQPYDDATIDAGLRLAGIDVPAKPLKKSRTIVASTAAAGATVAPVIVEAATSWDRIRSALQPFAEHSEAMRLVLAGVTVAAIGVVIWARIDDQNKERRA